MDDLLSVKNLIYLNRSQPVYKFKNLPNSIQIFIDSIIFVLSEKTVLINSATRH